jgi:hypothetical protein
MTQQTAAISIAPRAASAPRPSNILFRFEPTNHLKAANTIIGRACVCVVW